MKAESYMKFLHLLKREYATDCNGNKMFTPNYDDEKVLYPFYRSYVLRHEFHFGLMDIEIVTDEGRSLKLEPDGIWSLGRYVYLRNGTLKKRLIDAFYERRA